MIADHCEGVAEKDAIAVVLIKWLLDHGYSMRDAHGVVLVSTDVIREDLVKVRTDNPSSGSTKEGRRWNRAVDKMFRLVDYYERMALSGGESNV